MNHHWTEEDDIVVLYLYKFGTNELPHTIDSIAKARGISSASLRMRIGNMKAVAEGSGLGHYAKLTESVYRRLRHASADHLRSIAFPELVGR
jgi:hypothetical protein